MTDTGDDTAATSRTRISLLAIICGVVVARFLASCVLFVLHVLCVLAAALKIPCLGPIQVDIFCTLGPFIACFSCLLAGWLTADIAEHNRVLNAFLSGAARAISELVWVFAFAFASPDSANACPLDAASLITDSSLCLLAFSGAGFLNSLLNNHRPRRRQWRYVTRTGRELSVLVPRTHRVAAELYFAGGMLSGLVVVFGPTVIWLKTMSIQSEISAIHAGVRVGAARPHAELKEMEEVAQSLRMLQTDLLLTGIFTCLVCYKLGNRRTPLAADTVLKEDPRPPVLYLRPFSHDGRKPFDRWWETVFNSLAAAGRKTFEELVVNAFQLIGPVVAIGRPDEILPQSGAARVYVQEELWQELVTDIMLRSQAVVVQAGDSKGVRWEFEEAGTIVTPARVVLFFSHKLGRGREKKYQAFRNWAQQVFPAPLPDTIGESFFVYFSREPIWRPRTLMPDGEVPDDHPLIAPLLCLRRESAFRSRRRSWYVLIITIIILVCIILLMRGCQ